VPAGRACNSATRTPTRQRPRAPHAHATKRDADATPQGATGTHAHAPSAYSCAHARMPTPVHAHAPRAPHAHADAARQRIRWRERRAAAAGCVHPARKMTRQARAFTRPAHAPSGLPHATRRRHDWWCARSATPQHVGDTPAPSRRRPPPVRPRVGAPSCAPAPLSPTPCVARTQHEGSTTGPRAANTTCSGGCRQDGTRAHAHTAGNATRQPARRRRAVPTHPRWAAAPAVRWEVGGGRRGGQCVAGGCRDGQRVAGGRRASGWRVAGGIYRI